MRLSPCSSRHRSRMFRLGPACVEGEHLERGRIEIADHRGVDGAGDRAAGANRGGRRFVGEGRGIGRHEHLGARRARQRHFLPAGQPHISADRAVPIAELVDKGEPDFGHVAASHSFTGSLVVSADSGLPTMTTILPSRPTSMRATSTPAARAPRTARARSVCLKLLGFREARASTWPPRPTHPIGEVALFEAMRLAERSSVLLRQLTEFHKDELGHPRRPASRPPIRLQIRLSHAMGSFQEGGLRSAQVAPKSAPRF